MNAPDRREMLAPGDKTLSIRRQCALLGVARSSVYQSGKRGPMTMTFPCGASTSRSRRDAARVGGMERQTLRDWAHRFNDQGQTGSRQLVERSPPRLSAEQRADVAELVETASDRAVRGVVRWRRVDLHRIIAEHFGVVCDERTGRR
jgi:predicted DNA-binding transcriptional regulator AlpA